MELSSHLSQPRASESVKNEPNMALLKLKIGAEDRFFRVETTASGKVLVVCIGTNSEGWQTADISSVQPLPIGAHPVSEEVEECYHDHNYARVRVASFPSHRGAAFSFSAYEWQSTLAGLESYDLGKPVSMEQAAVSGERVTFRAFFDRFFGEA